MTLGRVIRNFLAPGQLPPVGLTWDGAMLWLSLDTDTPEIWQVDPVTGTGKRVFTTALLEHALCWDGRTLWAVNWKVAALRQYDPVTGTLIQTLAINIDWPLGVAWDGRCFWVTGAFLDRIYQVNAQTGSTTVEWITPGGTPGDVCWDGAHLWHCDYDVQRVYQLDPNTGTMIRYFNAPATDPLGVTFDGRTLWVCDDVACRIYQIAIN